MKKENGIINLGAISILMVSTLMFSLGIIVYNTKTSSGILNSAKNAKNQTNYYTNSTNSMFDDAENTYDENSDFDLDDYSNFSDYSFGNYTEE